MTRICLSAIHAALYAFFSPCLLPIILNDTRTLYTSGRHNRVDRLVDVQFGDRGRATVGVWSPEAELFFTFSEGDCCINIAWKAATIGGRFKGGAAPHPPNLRGWQGGDNPPARPPCPPLFGRTEYLICPPNILMITLLCLVNTLAEGVEYSYSALKKFESLRSHLQIFFQHVIRDIRMWLLWELLFPSLLVVLCRSSVVEFLNKRWGIFLQIDQRQCIYGRFAAGWKWFDGEYIHWTRICSPVWLFELAYSDIHDHRLRRQLAARAIDPSPKFSKFFLTNLYINWNVIKVTYSNVEILIFFGGGLPDPKSRKGR